MSPRSRGRPPGRGRRRKPGSHPAAGREPAASAVGPGDKPAAPGQEPEIRFDQPAAGDRLSWAAPPGRGTWRGMDVELLDPGNDDELGFLIDALHHGRGVTPGSSPDLTSPDQAGSPRLHVTMHQIVARQILDDDPPETWQAVQRLAGLGYGWHDIMHMIARLVAEDVHSALAGQRQPDPADYARRLDELPAG